jgi:RNA polymerase sigma-70 factor (ECF subfamily)
VKHKKEVKILTDIIAENSQKIPKLRENSATLEEVYERQVNTVYKIAFTYLKNKSDAEDATADTFLKYAECKKLFNNSEHEKAWFIRIVINICKNMLKHPRRKIADIEEFTDIPIKDNDLAEAVNSLPEKYRIVVYLVYFEGYTSEETAKILKKNASTVRNWLAAARKILKDFLSE